MAAPRDRFNADLMGQAEGKRTRKRTWRRQSKQGHELWKWLFNATKTKCVKEEREEEEEEFELFLFVGSFSNAFIQGCVCQLVRRLVERLLFRHFISFRITSYSLSYAL